jgi:RNA polymerase sigma-70 factor, ECF subfamily
MHDAMYSAPRPAREAAASGAGNAEREDVLLRRAQQGDAAAFYELVQPVERTLFAMAVSVLRNEADAEDVVQEAVLKAFKSISGFRADSKFSTWLVQITINEARMKLRKDRRGLYDSIETGQVNDDGEFVPANFADWREIPSEALELKELRDALAHALNSLPALYRQVLTLRDLQHFSIAETAVALGITEAAVKTRLLRARLQMREALAPGFDGPWRRPAAPQTRPF